VNIESAPRPTTGRDSTWIAVLATFFLYGLTVSWLRWGNPLIDTGREMNVPLRLVNGETLYSDIRHIYGPLSPWVHAALYRMFGPGLNVLYADGVGCAAVALALVYWLSRQLLSPAAAGVAALNVMWLCVFKQSGNYVLPYSYNALHGTVLGLATLAVLTRAVRASRSDERTAAMIGGFVAAGVLAGLTLLAKTEMGTAAGAAGTAAALIAPAPRGTRMQLLALFLAPAALVVAATYGLIATQVGWSTLVDDSWVLGYNVPRELATYNRHLSGLDRPLHSMWRILLACVKLGIVATVVAAASAWAARTSPRAACPERALPIQAGRRVALVADHPWRALAVALGVAAVLAVTTGLDWDKGPYLAMPVLLTAFLMALLRDLLHHRLALDSSLLLIYAVYALASLARVILHVQSGGAYGSYLLPVSIVIFTYWWVGPFAGAFRDERTAGIARRIALALLLLAAVGSAALLGRQYRTRSAIAITSSRGTMISENDVGIAWNEALAYIAAHTQSGDPIVVLPEGTSLTFLSGRRNPLREEIVTPGFLDPAGEARAIRQLQAAHPPLVLIANRATAEFGPNAFGRDYCVSLMRWIESHYQRCALFGPAKDPRLQIGDPRFFIRAYCAAR
jgi:hypothetical protein